MDARNFWTIDNNGWNIGIDFGTANIRAAVVRNGEVEVIPDINGHSAMSSWITFHGNYQNSFGSSAKDSAPFHNDLTVRGVKRLLGRDWKELEPQSELERSLYQIRDTTEGPMVVDGRNSEVSPAHIAAILFRRIKFNAESYLMASVTQATIGLPVWFNAYQRKALRNAAFEAGFRRVDLIPEPTAVFLSQPPVPGNDSYQFIATVDIGADRCQVGIIRRQNYSRGNSRTTEDFKLLAGMASSEEIGGDLVDRRLLAYIMGHEDISLEGRGLCRLQYACETAKKELSEMDESHITMGELLGATVTRHELKTLTGDLSGQVRSCLDAAIMDGNITRYDITEVFLAGGAIRHFAMRNVVENYFAKTQPTIHTTGDQSLVKGLALCTTKLPNLDTWSTEPVKTSVHLGLASNAIGVHTSKDIGLCHIIERNDTIPSQRTKDFIYDTTYQTLNTFCHNPVAANDGLPRSLDGKIRIYEDSIVGPRLLGAFDIEPYVSKMVLVPPELRLRVTIVISTIESAWATITNGENEAEIDTISLINPNEEGRSNKLTPGSALESLEKARPIGEIEMERVSVLERLKTEVFRARENTMVASNRDAMAVVNELDNWISENGNAPIEKYYEQLDVLLDLAPERPLVNANNHSTTPADEERPGILEKIWKWNKTLKKTMKKPRSFMGSRSTEDDKETVNNYWELDQWDAPIPVITMTEEEDRESGANYRGWNAPVPVTTGTEETEQIIPITGALWKPVQIPGLFELDASQQPSLSRHHWDAEVPAIAIEEATDEVPLVASANSNPVRPRGLIELHEDTVGFDAILEIDRPHSFQTRSAVPPSRPREVLESRFTRESQWSDGPGPNAERIASYIKAVIGDGKLTGELPSSQDDATRPEPQEHPITPIIETSPVLWAPIEKQEPSTRPTNGHSSNPSTSSTYSLVESTNKTTPESDTRELDTAVKVATHHPLYNTSPKLPLLPSSARIPPVEGSRLGVTATSTASWPTRLPQRSSLSSSFSVEDNSRTQSPNAATSETMPRQELKIVKSSDSMSTSEKAIETPQLKIDLLKNPRHEIEVDMGNRTHPSQKDTLSAKTTPQTKFQGNEKVHPVHSISESQSMPPNLNGLESLFPSNGESRLEPYTDLDFERISTHLQNTGHVTWGRSPRLYTVLRLIDRIDLMPHFLTNDTNHMSDFLFPFSTEDFPAAITPTVQHQFLRQQGLVHEKSKAVQLENGGQKHATFSKDDPLPFKVVAKLGRGAHGSVEKVMSTLSQTEYARKVFRKARGLRSNEIRSFRNEMNTLKKVRHKHLVRLVST